MSNPAPVFLQLKEKAAMSAARSYSPYSRFPVGAAVISEVAFMAAATSRMLLSD